MNDRELAKAMRLIAECERRSGSAQPKTIEMLEAGAARLDAMRWRSVEEGLPDEYREVEYEMDDGTLHHGNRMGCWWCSGDVRVHMSRVTHWCYVTAPGEGE